MVSTQRLNRLFLLAIIGLSTVIAACSSGGSGGGRAAGDTTPDPFTLETRSTDPTEAPFDTQIVSAPTTITGIDTAAPISIEDGEYSVNDGAFTSTAGTVRNGQEVRVRVQSPIKAEQAATATLNVGGVAASFTVTTGPDTVPPEVSILFPPPASMTEGATLFMRGTVKDANGTLEEGAVTVNGVEAELEFNEAGDEGTWSVTVDLEPGENTLTVAAIDVAENVNDEEAVSSRRVASIEGESFPDNENPFGTSIKADIGWEDGKPVAYVADDTALALFKVDLTTGTRKMVATNDGVSEELKFHEPWGIHLGINEKLYVSDITRKAVFEVDPNSGARTVIAVGSEQPIWDRPTGLFLRVENNHEKLYVGDVQGKVFKIDIASGEETLIVDSREGLNPGGEQFPSVFDLEYMTSEDAILVSCRDGMYLIRSDEQQPYFDSDFQVITSASDSFWQNRIYYVNNSEYRTYLLNTETKQSIAVAGEGVNGVENQPVDLWDIAGDQNLDYLLIVDRKNGLIAMDHVSHKRVVVSKSAQ